MSSKTNIAPLFANYDTNNKSINHTDRLYVAGSKPLRNSMGIIYRICCMRENSLH